jgi:hypothetical protein
MTILREPIFEVSHVFQGVPVTRFSRDWARKGLGDPRRSLSRVRNR